MADEIIVETTSTEVIEVGVPGPQGPAGAAGTGLETLTTQGDTLYRGASTGERLPIGTTGQVLKVSAQGLPTWANESGAVTSVAGKTGVVTLDKNDVGLSNVSNTAQVTSVTGTAPIVSSGGTTPAISISAATTSAAGSMSSADKTKLDGIAAGAEVNVNADWNASSGDAQILNKPTLGGAAALNVGTTAGTVAAGDDARLTDSRTPTAHAAAHASAGSDPLAPSDIGAQSIFVTEDLGTVTANVTLTAARAKIYLVNSQTSGLSINLPTTNILAGDVVQIRFTSFNGQTLAVKRDGSFYGASLINGQQATYIAASTAANSWEESANNRHSHGNITNEGRIGTVSGLPVQTSSGGLLVAGAFGTSAGQFAEGNHTHAQLHDRSHAITSTSDHTAGNHKVFYSDGSGQVQELALGSSGTVLTSNGATSAPSFAAASGGVSAVNSTLADILSVSGSDLVADDLGSDKIYGWDDSASKAIGFTIGSGLSVSGDTLSATASGGSKTYAVFSAEHNQPPSTAFATLDTRNSIAVLDFDDATDESAVFVSIIPEDASLGSGLKIRLHWMATTATSGNVVWDVSLERMTTDLDSDSFDTIASGTAAANGTSGILTVTEITLTNIDSVTAGDGFRLKVTRDANNASDTMTGDAELVVCEVRSAA